MPATPRTLRDKPASYSNNPTKNSLRKTQPAYGMVETLESRVLLSTAAATTVQHDIYAVDTNGYISVYNMDNGHQLIKTIQPIQNGANIRGVAASAVTDTIYVAYINSTGGGIYAWNMLSDTLVWNKQISPSVDRLSISPDGKTLYSPTNESDTNPSDNYINIIDASNGNIERHVTVTTQTHDTLYPLSGPAFQSSKATNGTGNYLYKIDPTTFAVSKVGPFSSFLGPYSVNGTSTYAVANVNGLWGFQVCNLKTGAIATVNLPGSPPSGGTGLLHGVAWSPDETQVWLAGGTNNPHAYVFDMTTPMSPKLIKTLNLTNAGGTHWITFSIDGAYAYICPHKPTTDPVEVFDAHTDTQIATFATSEELLEVDFSGSTITRVGDQYGIGRVTSTTTPTVGSVTDLMLVNADTGADIEPLTNGVILDYATLPTRHLNVRADTSGTIGSVEFSLDGATDYHTANSPPPYSLAGNVGTTYNSWTPSVGTHSLGATPFSGTNLSGTGGTAFSVSVTVKDSTVSSGPKVTDLMLVNADTGKDIELLTNGITLDYATLPTRHLNVRADTSGTIGSVEFSLDGVTNYHTENSAPYALAGNVGTTYNSWTPTVGNHVLSATPFSGANDSGTAGTALTVNITVKDTTVTPPPAFSITRLVLVNADTGKDIEVLTDNITLDYATLGTMHLNIRADTSGTIGSVLFGLDGNASYHIENSAPYALAGNVGSTYNPWTPSVGTHTLTVTPYTGSKATGTAGTTVTIHFTVK